MVRSLTPHTDSTYLSHSTASLTAVRVTCQKCKCPCVRSQRVDGVGFTFRLANLQPNKESTITASFQLLYLREAKGYQRALSARSKSMEERRGIVVCVLALIDDSKQLNEW